MSDIKANSEQSKAWENQKVHDFKQSLGAGLAGEQALLKLIPGLVKHEGNAVDFVLPNGDTLELKTDSYDMSKTENFFMERWSSWKDKKPGGPWQSTAKWFVYMFSKNGALFVFKTAELVAELERHRFGGIIVRNKGWTTVGYKVPRALLVNLDYSVQPGFNAWRKLVGSKTPRKPRAKKETT